MRPTWKLYTLLSTYLMAMSLALPTSLVQEIKSSEVKSNKVKRAQPDHNGPEENIGRMSYFNDKPTSAIKRGANLKDTDDQDWSRDQLFRGGDFSMDTLQSGLFNSANLPLDDKSIAEYEKGYRYGINKDKLDEALENAILKGEIYGDPYSHVMKVAKVMTNNHKTCLNLQRLQHHGTNDHILVLQDICLPPPHEHQ